MVVLSEEIVNRPKLYSTTHRKRKEENSKDVKFGSKIREEKEEIDGDDHIDACQAPSCFKPVCLQHGRQMIVFTTYLPFK
jgi:hypothetical protein